MSVVGGQVWVPPGKKKKEVSSLQLDLSPQRTEAPKFKSQHTQKVGTGKQFSFAFEGDFHSVHQEMIVLSLPTNVPQLLNC